MCLSIIVNDGFAYTPVQTQTISAGAMIGGSVSGEPFRIRHSPLNRASEVTREIVIIGEAGVELPPQIPSFDQRFTPFSDFGPLENRNGRIKILYRFLQDLDDPEPPPFTESSVVEGAEPIAFAFEIPSEDVLGPILQYRIVAEGIRYTNDQATVVSRVTFPPTTPQDPNPSVTLNVQANAAQVFNQAGGRFSLNDGNPEDGQTTVDIPAGLFRDSTLVTVDEIPVTSPLLPPGLSSPLVAYQLSTDPRVNGTMRVSLLYPDFEFPQGQDGLVDGTDIREEKLSVAWWDGFQWRILGALGNYRANTLSVNVSFLSFMAIVQAAPLSAEGRRPMEKIITPNGDGIQDSVTFIFGDRTDNIKVDIFDINGHRVRTVNSNVTLQWDGRDDSGNVVESGVYIYQYRIDGTLVSGVIAVAK